MQGEWSPIVLCMGLLVGWGEDGRGTSDPFWILSPWPASLVTVLGITSWVCLVSEAWKVFCILFDCVTQVSVQGAVSTILYLKVSWLSEALEVWINTVRVCYWVILLLVLCWVHILGTSKPNGRQVRISFSFRPSTSMHRLLKYFKFIFNDTWILCSNVYNVKT